jgi:2-methylcitrate dehydratase
LPAPYPKRHAKTSDDGAKDDLRDETASSSGGNLSRRDLMKLGTGAVVAKLATRATSTAAAQELTKKPAKGHESTSRPSGYIVKTGTGWKNTANRAFGNGPMDDTTRQLVSYVHSYPESNLTGPVLGALGRTMVDALASMISGFESEPVRISARIARANRADLKCTVLGYGITTSPEAATFANSSMVRHTDYNDMEPVNHSHSSVMIPGIMAIGEGVHSTGRQVLVAVTLAYEILSSLTAASVHREKGLDGPYEGPATALAVGRLLGLNEDQLANALSLAVVPHLPLLVAHTGALSMWKGCHSAMAVRSGVEAALLAHEGMTGPCQPFEGRNGLWDTITGPFEEIRLPYRTDRKMIVEDLIYKRFPAEGSTQEMLDQVVPRIREWAKPDEIASINIEAPSLEETQDPPKWDPKNRETADHSAPYVLAVAIIDGDVYMNSFTPKRYLDDAAIRNLMDRTTCQVNPDFKGLRKRVTVRKKTGEVLVKDVYDFRPMSPEEITAKFRRACDYMSVSNQQRDHALATWSSLEKVQDFAEPMRDMAKFGSPKPL